MLTVIKHIRRHLLATLGMEELLPSLDTLHRTEWSLDFEKLMRNRLIMGAFRYGCLGAHGKPQYDRIASIQTKCKKYLKDGNQEHLVDIANIALCEFVEGTHPKKHFRSVGEEQLHVKETQHDTSKTRLQNTGNYGPRR